MSTEPRPIKVTNLADKTISGNKKVIENAKTGKVTAVIVVMCLSEKWKINLHIAIPLKKWAANSTERPLQQR